MRCDRPARFIVDAVAPFAGRALGGVVALAGAVALTHAVGCAPAPLPEGTPFVPAVDVPACRGNNDGVITLSELPVVTGVVARLRIGTDVAVDVDGVVDDDGVTVWDLSRPDPASEPVATLSAEPMAGQWFAGLFPTASVAAPLVPGNAQLGPLLVDDDGWRLLGAASRDEQPAEGQTRVVYDEPAALYPFPMQEGARASSSSRADNALLFGVPTAFVDDIDVDVSARGRVVLPDLVLDNTLRVTVRLRRTLLAGDVQQVSHLFVHECLGEVARFASEAVPLGATLDDDFAVAAEVWRLSL